MSVAQEAVNLLVWRYMKESGFEHSAFLFESESQIDTTSSDVQQIPSVALVSYLQKALRYMENERVINHARNNPESREYATITALEARFPEPAPAAEEVPAPSAPPKAVQLSPTVVTVLAAHRLMIYSCRFSPSGNILATASDDGTVILWLMPDGAVTGHLVLGEPTDVQGSTCAVSCLDWSPDGRLLAAGSLDTHVRVYNQTGRMEADITGHSHYVFVVKFNKNGTKLVTAGADKTVLVWSVPGFVRTQALTFHTDTVLDISWRDNECFATASADSTIGICHVSGTLVQKNAGTGDVHVVRFNGDGSILASGGNDGVIRLWKNDYNDVVELSGHANYVSALEWLPTNDSLISGSVDGTLRVWDAVHNCCLRVIEQHECDIYAITMSPNGEYVASGSKDQKVVVSKVSTGEQVASFIGNSGVYDVNYDPQGRFIAAGFEDATVAVIPVNPYLASHG